MKVPKAFFPAFLSASLLAGICSASQGQTPPAPTQDVPVRLTLKQAASFPETLKALAAQGRVAFVAEGSPLAAVLAEAKAPDLQHDTPLPDAVGKIAAAYDYAVSRQGDVFLLEKNYTDPADLPAVTPAECVLALKDVQLVMAGFDPHMPQQLPGQDSPLIADLMHSLTPAQAQAMQAGSLRVVDLTPEQRNSVYRLGLYFYIGGAPTVMVNAAISALSDLPAYTVGVADWHPSEGQNFPHLFGYRRSASPDGKTFQPFENVATQNGIVVGQTVDVNAIPPPAPAAADAGQTTLAKAVAALALGGRKPVAVDAALREKPVTVAGAENAPPAQVLNALADVYGLRVRTDDKGARFLTRVAFRIPLDVAGVPLEVRRVLPLPLLHKIHDSAIQQSYPTSNQLIANDGAAPGPPQLDARQRMEMMNKPAKMAAATRKAELKYLYAAVAPRLKAAPGRFVPFTDLTEPARLALTLYKLNDVTDWVVNTLPFEVPINLARPDIIVLAGKRYKGKDGEGRFMLTLKCACPDGKLFDIISTFNLSLASGGGE